MATIIILLRSWNARTFVRTQLLSPYVSKEVHTRMHLGTFTNAVLQELEPDVLQIMNVTMMALDMDAAPQNVHL